VYHDGVTLIDWLVLRGHTGKPNPVWVEWLMGFPANWTDLEPSETL